MKNHINKIFMAAVLVGSSNLALADPFSVSWTTTIMGQAGTAPYNTGELLSVTIVLDNGGNTAASQTWDPDTDAVSITLQLNDAPNTVVLEFDPSASGSFSSLGDFQTDAGGNFTAVPIEIVLDAAVPVSSNDTSGASDYSLAIDGLDALLYGEAGSLFIVGADNFADNITAGAWSAPAPVIIAPPAPPAPPAPAADPLAVPVMPLYALLLSVFGVGLSGALGLRRKSAA